MSTIKTNIFPIRNLDALSTEYVLYRIRGLNRQDNEYFQNKDELARKLSYKMHKPGLVIECNGEPHLVLPSDAPAPPQPFSLVRAQVYFDDVGETLALDYAKRDPEQDAICLRFLNFLAIQGSHWNDNRLWQPRSGQPFFEYDPVESVDGLDIFHGFSARPVVTPEGGIGICLDLRTKFVATKPLHATLTRDDFRQYRGEHFVYRFHNWYEVRLQDYCDLNASELYIDGETVLDYLKRKSAKPLPKELANLPDDAALAYYQGSRSQHLCAAVGLCHRIYDTQNPTVQKQQRRMTPPPHRRYQKIQEYARKYLRDLRLGDARLDVAMEPSTAPRQVFRPPDVEFGRGQSLSVRGTPGAWKARPDTLGRERQRLLEHADAGFFVKRPLGTQYLFLPKSVYDTWGQRYIEDLQEALERLYGPAEHDEVLPDTRVYEPQVVVYDDESSGRTFREQGQTVLDAAARHGVHGGYGLVMIHDASDRRVRQEDQLAAMLSQQFWEQHDMRITVNHTKTGNECYVARNGTHVVQDRRRRKLNGYLRNVALNKILLNNEVWPFVLATPLHADLTVGLDVKHNTAGLTVVSKDGRSIATTCRKSNQKEKLTRRQIATLLSDLLRDAIEDETVREIVIHRDGRSFQSELDGAQDAVRHLQEKDVLPADARLTVLDVSKMAMVRVRLFDVRRWNGRPWIDNPQNGTHIFLGNRDAHLCSTGREYRHQGTAQLLHVRHVLPGLPFEQALEDLYALTTLAWSKPDDCSRFPITMKLTDRWLWQDATDYDQDALDYGDEER